MPLDYVTSNAGHPMLLIDRYTFHRHSSNPKSGRINWRCSRRRVKDIRCGSSCHSVNESASQPTVHHPNCLPLTDAELLACDTKRGKLSSSHHYRINSIEKAHISNTSDTENNNLSNELIFNKDNNYMIDSFDDREVGSDEEELNEVLNDLNGDVIEQDNKEDFSGVNIHSILNLNSNIDEMDEEVLGGSDIMKENSYDSIDNDIPESTDTISSIIEATSKNLTTRNDNDVYKLQSHPHKIFQKRDRPTNKIRTLPLDHSSDITKSIYFVTSKVGHPMLVVDQHTFHKHSMNPKNNRINWRCSRRRVKEIRCPSSCYTVDGVVSNPTPHDSKCCPLSEAMLANYQNNRAKVSMNGFINTKVDSFTTLKHRADSNHIENTMDNEFDQGYEDNNNNNSNPDSTNEEQTTDTYDTMFKTKPKFQFARNKRKENLPVRSNESQVENLEGELEINGDLTNGNIVSDADPSQENANCEQNFFQNDMNYQESKYRNGNFMYYNNNNNDDDNEDEELEESNLIDSSIQKKDNDGDVNFMDHKQSASGSEILNGEHLEDINNNDLNNSDENSSINEYDPVNNPSSPQAVSKLVNELNELKRREKRYLNRLKSANGEVSRIKHKSNLQIQSLRWKLKMMEIDMSSLKSSICQKNMENSSLKKLVDEMMSKLKSDCS